MPQISIAQSDTTWVEFDHFATTWHGVRLGQDSTGAFTSVLQDTMGMVWGAFGSSVLSDYTVRFGDTLLYHDSASDTFPLRVLIDPVTRDILSLSLRVRVHMLTDWFYDSLLIENIHLLSSRGHLSATIAGDSVRLHRVRFTRIAQDTDYVNHWLNNDTITALDTASQLTKLTVQFSLRSDLGIAPTKKGSVFAAFPTVAGSALKIHTGDGCMGGHYVIYDELGRRVLEGTLPAEPSIVIVDLRRLTAGFYHFVSGGVSKRILLIR